MPCLSTNAYYKQVNSILGVVENYSWEELLNASQKPRNIIVDDNQAVDETASAAVSLDGTWAKRGFSSLTGVFFAISVNTGEVLDYTALSKACQKRALKESQCEGDDKKFLGWRREHLATGECDINFNGSSPALEAEWAFILWRRSIELQKKKNITSGWCLTETGKLSKLLKICTCWIESYYIGLYWPCPKENVDAPFELKSKDKGKLEYGKPIGGRGRLTDTK